MVVKRRATSWWALSAVVADRSGESARLCAAWPRARLRRATTGASTWLKLAGGLGRANDDGSAVLCLTPPTWRGRARCIAVAVVVAVALVPVVLVVSERWAWLAGGAILATLVAIVPAARVAWSSRKADGRLRAERPAGGWHLCDFARSREAPEGMGAVLLERVCAEADAHERVLYLETSAKDLVTYYEEFGFKVEASEAMAWGETRTTVSLMVRPVGGCTRA